MAHEQLIAVARDYVQHLVRGDYHYTNGLVLDSAYQLSPPEIALFLADCGATLIQPPETAYQLAPPYAPAVRERGVTVQLWTLEEGPSTMILALDITLEPPHAIVGGYITGCPPKLVPALQELIHHLVTVDYQGLDDHGHTGGTGMTSEDVMEAILGYRARAWEYSETRIGTFDEFVLVDMPASAFKDAHAVHIRSTPGTWGADVKLWWNDAHSQGDLSVRLQVATSADGELDIQIVGLEVM